MIKNLLSLTLLVLSYSALFAQDNISVADISGSWFVDKIEITSLSEVKDIDETNCYWANVKSLNQPVVFSEDGIVKFFKVLHDEKPTEVSAQYEIKQNDLKLIFNSGTATITGADGQISNNKVSSYTSYEIVYLKNGRLKIKIENPLVIEQYTFVKK